jgi:hypothetical protein
MRKLYDNNGIAVLTGMLVSYSFPLLRNTHHMLSDSLFIALTVVALYFLSLSRRADTYPSTGNLFIASICASAAILTRYAGVALIPVFFWEAFVLVKNKRIKSKYFPVALAAVLPIITTGSLFIRNYIVSGTLLGWNPPSPERSYYEAFTGTIRMILLQFNLGEKLITLTTFCAIILILFTIVNTNTRRELSKYIRSGLDFVIVFMITYTLLISYSMAKSQTVFELRYISPLVPSLFILSIIIIAVVWQTIRLKGFSRLSLCGMILSLGIITVGVFYKTYANSGPLFSKQAGHYRILNSPTYKWIKENYGENVIITTNRPFHLSFFGGYSTIRLPHRRFNRNYRIPDSMESFLPERMFTSGSRVLALFEEAEEQYEGSYVAGLFSERKDDDNFVLTQKFSDGVLYHLKE